MKKALLEKAAKHNLVRRRKKLWRSVVTFMAAVVVFCTTYALILPAITLDNQTVCGLEEHTHTEACYQRAAQLVCTDEAHSHSAGCYDENGDLTCGCADFLVHTHNAFCYGEDGKLICTLPVIEAHTHSDSCYEEIAVESTETEAADETTEATETPEATEATGEQIVEMIRICGKEEIVLHSHTDSCYAQSQDGVMVLCCGMAEVREHIHDESCIAEQSVLDCGLQEHTHDSACMAANVLSSDEQAEVDAVVAKIDALPTADEIDAQMLVYEEAGDAEQLETWYSAITEQVGDAYWAYSALNEKQKAAVTNTEKLMALEHIWRAATFSITEGLGVYQINCYDGTPYTSDNTDKGVVLVNGKSAADWGIDSTFAWWSAIVVEENENGVLYVSEVITEGSDDSDKSGYAPNTQGGFVLYVWHSTVAPADMIVEVGNIVSVAFDRTQTGAYTGYSYGAVTFADGVFKSDKDNTSKLDIVHSADTLDLIEVNLYDYGSDINTLYNSDSKYPGFQQDDGAQNVGTSFSQYQSFNFGNNITSDLSAGLANVTVKDGTTINATATSYGGKSYGYANIPVSGTMLPTLQNGYPALADGTSLDYLFSTGTYATKQNSANINGLFKHNSVTGAYTFNSRENHAQFNKSSNTFTLYKQLISSNFMMYPFGNFLPFNDITKLSAQASTIDRAYLLEIANSAQYKADSGYNRTSNDEYGTLATQLKAFVSLMDAKFGTDWDAYDAVNQYFASAGISAQFSETSPTLHGGALLDYIYSIDYDEETNFYFGMEMKMTFMQPEDGLTGNDTNGDGIPDYEMVFYFTGDDDVWVYVDEVLFLDLSGIHRHVGGEIDFTNGVVKYYNLSTSSGDVSGTPYKTVTFAEILGTTDGLNDAGTFEDYTTHSFNFYYTERGAGSGVCRMNFNFPLLRRNSISVEKDVSTDTAIKGDPDYEFQVLKADTDGTKTETLFVGANVSYAIYDTNNDPIGTGTTDANGVFTLKAGQRAEFADIEENAGKYYVRELLEGTVLEQYGNVTVSGESTTRSGEIIIGSDTFIGMDSPVTDMSDGTTFFRFMNAVDETKLGSLSVTKRITEFDAVTEDKSFDIEVTLDGQKLPVGTVYTVGNETREVETEGILAVKAGETAVISNILAGSKFTVQETSESAKGYVVTYSDKGGDSVATSEGIATGAIKTDAAVELVVNNTEKGTTVTVTGSKTILLPDSADHSYTFSLVEVTDQTGSVTRGEAATTEISVVDAGAFSFELRYGDVDPGVYYYRITEDPSLDSMENATAYVIAVTVSEDAEENLCAEVSGVWKDGVNYTGETLEFVNTLVGDLTLSKLVFGGSHKTAFSFTVSLAPGTSGLEVLPDSYAATWYYQDGTTESTTVVFTDSMLTLAMKHGESIVLHGIPNGTEWIVTETDSKGYIVSYSVDNGTEFDGYTVSGTVDTDGVIVEFINSVGYVLPKTGGMGTTLYTMTGLALSMGASGLLYRKKKRRKEADPS